MSFLLDTSVWVAYARSREAGGVEEIDRLLDLGSAQLLGCPAVRMELALDPQELRRRRLLRLYDGLPTTGVTADDFDQAAAIYRAVRSVGHTIRSMTDCLIVAAALRTEATVVHDDVDFDRICDAVPQLTTVRLSG